MLFSSTIFIYLFLPLVLFGYYVVFRKSRLAQNVFLLLTSLFFYAWGEPKFVLVMLLSIVANWFFGLLVHNAKKSDSRLGAKLIIALTCVFNLSLLFVFKYLNFTSAVMCNAGFDVEIYSIALPIGISFFTFQAMSYVLDVYRDRGEMQKNVLNVGLYVSFFPQLIAGPIVRYETVAWEIANRRETISDFFDGFSRFIVGLGKKVLLANTFALLADKAFGICSSEGIISSQMAWLGAISYTMQIFFDFSGYSDMAIGLGKMFGFHFLENFNYPYISKSITEFWRRWHISLGTWFRDYVYFPLGGSRVKSKLRLVFNLFVVWMLTGIWHGAEWSFFAWGFMYFVLLTAEKLTGFDKKEGKILNMFKYIYTLLFVIIGWVLFRAETMYHAWTYLKCMFSFDTLSFDGMAWGYFTQNAIMLAIGVLCCTPVCKRLSNRFESNTIYSIVRIVALCSLFVLCMASLVSNSYNPFIYFNF